MSRREYTLVFTYQGRTHDTVIMSNGHLINQEGQTVIRFKNLPWGRLSYLDIMRGIKARIEKKLGTTATLYEEGFNGRSTWRRRV